jgi:bifunctional DNA-binding transcriptional regulator/antitoxin component of YhaV-PrlF toxin-antitoxin module
MSGLESPDASEGDQFLGSAKVQNSKGSIRVTVPADAASELNLKKGDRVVFRSRDGDVVAEKASDLF